MGLFKTIGKIGGGIGGFLAGGPQGAAAGWKAGGSLGKMLGGGGGVASSAWPGVPYKLPSPTSGGGGVLDYLTGAKGGDLIGALTGMYSGKKQKKMLKKYRKEMSDILYGRGAGSMMNDPIGRELVGMVRNPQRMTDMYKPLTDYMMKSATRRGASTGDVMNTNLMDQMTDLMSAKVAPLFPQTLNAVTGAYSAGRQMPMGAMGEMGSIVTNQANNQAGRSANLADAVIGGVDFLRDVF